MASAPVKQTQKGCTQSWDLSIKAERQASRQLKLFLALSTASYFSLYGEGYFCESNTKFRNKPGHSAGTKSPKHLSFDLQSNLSPTSETTNGDSEKNIQEAERLLSFPKVIIVIENAG